MCSEIKKKQSIYAKESFTIQKPKKNHKALSKKKIAPKSHTIVLFSIFCELAYCADFHVNSVLLFNAILLVFFVHSELCV